MPLMPEASSVGQILLILLFFFEEEGKWEFGGAKQKKE